MNTFIAARIRRLRAADQGFSIVEVLVAALIFVIVAVAIAQSMVNAIRLSGDAQHRSVALNIASAEIDYQKGRNNPYAVSSTTAPITSVVDGVTYSLTRSASWVSVNGNEISCAAQSGNFQLLRLRVRVTWGGRMPTSLPVNVTTTLSPQNTILSPTTATLFISVSKADGTPNAGVVPTVTSTTSGKVVTAPATNSDGCSYLSGVNADTYQVRVSSTGGIDSDQNTTGIPKTDPTVVTAGSAVAVLFAYDQAATLALTYGPGGGAILPNNLTTTYSATSQDTYYASGSPTSVPLFPVTSGYSVVAGSLTPASGGYGACSSPDPANWTAASVSGTALRAGVDPANAVATPGATTNYAVAMGRGTVTTSRSGFVKLVSSNSTQVSGDPGCPNNASGAQQTYFYPVPSGTSALAIPYGAWNATFATTQTGSYSNISVTPTNSYAGSGGNTFTMDPRTP